MNVYLLASAPYKAMVLKPVVLKLGRFGQWIRNTWKVLKCGAGEGWKRSVGLIM